LGGNLLRESLSSLRIYANTMPNRDAWFSCRKHDPGGSKTTKNFQR
jgi:hypothetical protein